MKIAQPDLAIGIDLGGTNIKAVVVDREGNRLLQTTRSTGEHHEAENEWSWKNAVRDTFLDLKKQFNNRIVAAGLSAPGIANASNSAILCMPGRLYGLENFDWSAFLGQKTYVVNDAHAATMAEARFGAAKGFRHAVLLTLGTGIGGGVVIDGELYQGLGQVAGHVGHTTINALDDQLDATGMPGSIEDSMGNESIERRSHGRFHAAHEVVEAYQKGDHLATWLWLNSVRKLAVSICSISNLLSPEIVVIGGGIAKAGDALFQPLQAFVDLYEWRPGGKKTAIVKAVFGEYAGATGVAAFSLQQFDKLMIR
jgi:glucokinase